MTNDTLIDPIKKIGKDSTATFEDDPTFMDANPGGTGSSENVEEQRDTDDVEDSEEEIEDGDDVDEDEEFDDEDEDDEDDLDDEEEVAASSGVHADTLRADGLLGYEDEADDAEKGRTPEQGNAERARTETRLKQPGATRRTGRATDTEGDDDAGDLAQGVSEDDLTENDMDTDRVTALPVDLLQWPSTPYGFREYIGSQPNTFGMLQ